jgi:hypothetical protein
MTKLDGTWNVHRAGGLLPPLLGVQKRIEGTSGETRLGMLPGAPFDIVGLELHYRRPFTGFVDVLAIDGDQIHGRALFRGHEFGRFTMTRA